MRPEPGPGRFWAKARLIVACLLGLAAWPALALDLPALMALLAGHRSGEAAFSEQRFVQGIDVPLLASGTLSFQAPDRFVRRTLKPRAETMEVDANQVTLSRGGRSRSFSLDAMPEMVGLVEAIRATLSGNEATLRRHFDSVVSGDAERWTLVLTPLQARLAAQVRLIRISGRRGELRSVEMELAGGDRSLMTIEAMHAGPAASAAPTQ